MKLFAFWHKWLKLVSVFTFLFGMVLCFFTDSVIFNWMHKSLDKVFLNEPMNPEALQYKNFIIAVLGSAIAAWGIFMYFLTTYAISTKQKWARLAFIVSLAVWYISDTAVSASYQVYFNVIFNTIFLALYMVPLLAIKSSFK
jgi:hypothetical protein